MKNNILGDLNPSQKEAVLYFKSPLLIIAGAGSGKTKVITHKIAYLVLKKDLSPVHILGVTFTNRAANEMRNRIESLTHIDSKLFNISTFHSLGLKILRQSSPKSNFDSEWQIIDDTDQSRIIEKIIKQNFNYFTNDMRENTKRKINFSKMNLNYPNNPHFLIQKGFNEDELKIYSLYYEYQKQNKLWDFEDLISLPVKLIQNSEEFKQTYSKKFKYVVVDEFQDTNPNQYELIRLIAKEHKNITVVGDDDQAIYSWRGANVRFLFDFEQDFPGTHILKLEQNYRSTQQILNFANTIINNNSYRRVKSMWTEKKSGNPVYLLHTNSKEDESEKIADLIQNLKQTKPELFPIAVLYRINSQSLAFETAFLKKGINFKIIKGMRFFERKEIKDSIALLKLTLNLDDDTSFLRIIDFLPLKIGTKTLDSLYKVSHEKKQSLFLSLKKYLPDKYNKKDFFSKIFELNQNQNQFKFSEILTIILDQSKYLETLKNKTEEDRILNIEELIEFIQKWEVENPGELFSKLSDRINMNTLEKREKNPAGVYLLTMHNAKGLEFPTVVAAGINSVYMPFFLRKNRNEIEEERRLFYVASTRAINQLILSGGSERQSKFLSEIYHPIITTVYSVDELLNYLSPENQEDKNQSQMIDGRMIRHPLFGTGRILQTIDKEKYVVLFNEKGEKTIDTSIVKITFI